MVETRCGNKNIFHKNDSEIEVYINPTTYNKNYLASNASILDFKLSTSWDNSLTALTNTGII